MITNILTNINIDGIDDVIGDIIENLNQPPADFARFVAEKKYTKNLVDIVRNIAHLVNCACLDELVEEFLAANVRAIKSVAKDYDLTFQEALEVFKAMTTLHAKAKQ